MPVAKRVRFCPATNSHIDIGYESFGNEQDPTILLVPGLSATGRMYDVSFTTALAAKGYHVIAIDNRDVGESTNGGDKDWPQPWLYGLLAPKWMSPAPLYTLEDMARDAWALLDQLKIKFVNLVGFSMGSMITQWMLLQQPTRVRSLCCGTGTTGGKNLSSAPLWVNLELLKTAPKDADLDTYCAWKANFVQKVFMPPKDEEQHKKDHEFLCGHVKRAQERITYRFGTLRQVYAVVHDVPGRRENFLSQLTEPVPVLVFHGKKDLVFGEDHAERVVSIFGKEHTKTLMIDNMGHFMEPKFFPVFIDGLDDMVKRGMKKAASSASSA